jgi:hypothetical protein
MVPSVVILDVLYTIALLTDKHSLSQALHPWSKLWIRALGSTAIAFPGYEKLLCISVVFEQPEIFQQVTKKKKKLLLEATIDSDDEMVTTGGKKFSEGVKDSIISMKPPCS